jgi:hypothetical protein
VTVLVLNGSGLPGIANKGVEALKQPGYPASVGNAKAKVDATVVYVVEGFEADGAAVAGVLLEPAAPVRPLSEPFPPEVGDPGNAKVVVVLSKDSPLAKGKAR